MVESLDQFGGAVKILLAAFVYLFLGCGSLLAATINFNSFAPGVATTPLRFPEVLISESSGGSLFVYGKRDFGMPANGGVCALQSDFSCTGDVSLLFIGPVSNLTFRGYEASPSDRATISAYSEDAVLSVMLVSGTRDGKFDVDFSGVSGITRVEIADGSRPRSRGIAYGDFAFDPDPPAPPGPPKPPPSFLSFDSFKSGINSDVLDLGQAVVREISGGKIFIYRSGDFHVPKNGAVCAYQGGKCLGDFVLEFKFLVFDLSFAGFFAKPTDSTFISLFDGDKLVYSNRYHGNSGGTIRFDFSRFGKLTKILFMDASNPFSKGIAFGDFKYRPYVAPPQPAPVPVPATLFLLIAGLALLSFLRALPTRRTIRLI